MGEPQESEMCWEYPCRCESAYSMSQEANHCCSVTRVPCTLTYKDWETEWQETRVVCHEGWSVCTACSLTTLHILNKTLSADSSDEALIHRCHSLMPHTTRMCPYL